MIDELKARGVQDCEIYAPYFIMSYAEHIFNLMNKENNAFTHGGLTLNARIPIIYMGPPGCGKSYLMEHLTNQKNGIFWTDGTEYKIAHEQSMSEAGLIGSVKLDNTGTPQYLIGAAEEHSDGFIVIDEFTDMMKVIKSSGGHSSQMEGQILSALDSGRVRKRLSAGAISYDTDFTLWCGIQPMKCDLSGGLGRRVCMLLNVPDQETKQRYKKASRAANKIKIDEKNIASIRSKIDLWRSLFRMIKHVEFTDEFLDFVDIELNTESFIMEFYKRLGLGYHLAKHGVTGDTIIVDINDELREIITRSNNWRNQVTEGPSIFQISDLIRKNGIAIENGYHIEKITLNHYASQIQLSAAQVHDNLLEMVKCGYAKISGTTIQLFKNPSQE